MRVLVTGVDGFTGKYIKAELERNGNVVTGLKSDLTDAKSVNDEVMALDPEAVIHLAGIAFVEHGDAREIYDVNLLGTRNLLKALSDSCRNIKSVLLSSSANVYGNCSSSKLTECCLPKPQNDYGVSKYAMEHMARLFLDKLPIIIARPFNYTGVGQSKKFVIPKIVSHFREKKTLIELGSLDVFREFGDVRCVALAYRKIIEASPIGETLNVCTSKPYALHQVLDMLEEITNHRLTVRVNSKYVRENEARVLSGSSERLDDLIGQWRTRNLFDTLNWMIKID